MSCRTQGDFCSFVHSPILLFICPLLGPLRPESCPLRPDISLIWPEISPLRPDIHPLRAEICPLRPEIYLSNLKSVLSAPGPKSALSSFKFALSDLKSGFSTINSDLRPQSCSQASNLPSQTSNWMDGQTNECPPSGPLPCFLSLQFSIIQSRATGIADHILPLGNSATGLRI